MTDFDQKNQQIGTQYNAGGDIIIYPPSATLLLSSAQQQFAMLPLDKLPNHAPLPDGSLMPFSANPLFVGRESTLQLLARIVKSNVTLGNLAHSLGEVSTSASEKGKAVAITGLGGIGKTQLATEFVHRYGQYFVGGVFWISFANASAVATKVAECGRMSYLNLSTRPEYDTLPLDDQVQLVRKAWQSPLPRLLVFDNCEDEKLLAQWRLSTGASYILITCRRAEWDQTLGVEVLPLDILQRDDSVRLLCKHAPSLQENSADLAAIAMELGDLPLALHLAGGFLNRYRFVQTPEAYLTQLRSTDLLNHPSLRRGGASPTDHEQHVSRTFAMSYRNLEPTNSTDKLALSLLARAICFAPGEPIPHNLLLTTLNFPDEETVPLFQAEDALLRLAELGLIERISTDGDVKLHRLVVTFLRETISDSGIQETVEQALAHHYEHIRITFVSSTQRTMKLDRLANYMVSFINQIDYGPIEIRQMFERGSEGYRLLAILAISVFPNQAYFDIVLNAIQQSRSAFEQYYALIAMYNILSLIDKEQKKKLSKVLIEETGSVIHIDVDTSRWFIKRNILNALQEDGILLRKYKGRERKNDGVSILPGENGESDCVKMPCTSSERLSPQPIFTRKDRDPNDALIQARKGHGWTQDELAALVGVSTTTYRQWEIGSQRPHLSHLKRLCELFYISFDMLGFDLEWEWEIANEIRVDQSPPTES